MQDIEFRVYLSNSHRGTNGATLSPATIATRIGNCKTVERYEGDLDELFEQDRLIGLIEKLTYSTIDARSGIPLRHNIPIHGNWKDGSATLKSAVRLYQQFKETSATGSAESRQAHPHCQVATKKLTWPTWPGPDEDEELALAKIVAKFARFLKPEIIEPIVDDNERNRVTWSKKLQSQNIDPRVYLWPKSSCAFPGIRRYAGSTELAIFKKHLDGQITDALAVDDNDYPKQLWSFVLTAHKFQKKGPSGYALAHVADHKSFGNRATEEFKIVSKENHANLYGLYTAPTNTVYLPTSLIRPSDFSHRLRNLLIRRAYYMYSSICALLPPWFGIYENLSPKWELDEFEWNSPVGTVEQVAPFLEFRRETMITLFSKARKRSTDSRT